MAANRLSNRDLDNLGERLRASSTPGPHDLALLQELRVEYDHALNEAQSIIGFHLPDRRSTARLKTVQTIVDKLRRHTTMSLQQVQDIAGIRLVEDMSLDGQDARASAGRQVSTIGSLQIGGRF